MIMQTRKVTTIWLNKQNYTCKSTDYFKPENERIQYEHFCFIVTIIRIMRTVVFLSLAKALIFEQDKMEYMSL